MHPTERNTLSARTFLLVQAATIGVTSLLSAGLQPDFWQRFSWYMPLLFPVLLVLQAGATHLCFVAPWRKRLPIAYLRKVVVQELVFMAVYLLYGSGIVLASTYGPKMGFALVAVTGIPFLIVTLAGLLTRCCSLGMVAFAYIIHPRGQMAELFALLPMILLFLVVLMGLLLALGVGYVRISPSYRLWQQRGRANGWLGLAQLIVGAALHGKAQRRSRRMLSSIMRYSSQGFSLRQRSSSNAGFQ